MLGWKNFYDTDFIYETTREREIDLITYPGFMGEYKREMLEGTTRLDRKFIPSICDIEREREVLGAEYLRVSRTEMLRVSKLISIKVRGSKLGSSHLAKQVKPTGEQLHSVILKLISKLESSHLTKQVKPTGAQLHSLLYGCITKPVNKKFTTSKQVEDVNQRCFSSQRGQIFDESGAAANGQVACLTDHDELVKMGDKLHQPNLDLLDYLIPKHKRSSRNFELPSDLEMAWLKRVDQVLEKFESTDNGAGVRAVVLWGMVGSGKSTLARKAAGELIEKRKIGQCCRILMQGDIDIKKKQETLYRELHKRGERREFSDSRQGRRELEKLFRDQLKAEPPLLIFDDADCLDDLEELLPENLETALPAGSIFLVTTINFRVISVLREKGVSCRGYEVNAFEKSEAEPLLLKKILGDQDLPVARQLVQSEPFLKVLNLCGGLPLAINEVGKFIRAHLQEFLGESLCEMPLGEAYSKLDSDGQVEFLQKLTEAVDQVYKALSAGNPISTAGSLLHRRLHFALKQLNSNPRIRDVFLDIVKVHVGRKWGDVELACGSEYLAELKHLSMVKCLTYMNGTSRVQEPVVQVHELLIAMSRKLEEHGGMSMPSGGSGYWTVTT